MRAIDADALIEDIREHSASYFADDFAHEWVDQQPTIEPERKKGKWIPQDFNTHSGKTSTTVYFFPICSVCGNSADYTTTVQRVEQT